MLQILKKIQIFSIISFEYFLRWYKTTCIYNKLGYIKALLSACHQNTNQQEFNKSRSRREDSCFLLNVSCIQRINHQHISVLWLPWLSVSELGPLYNCPFKYWRVLAYRVPISLMLMHVKQNEYSWSHESKLPFVWYLYRTQ